MMAFRFRKASSNRISARAYEKGRNHCLTTTKMAESQGSAVTEQEFAKDSSEGRLMEDEPVKVIGEENVGQSSNQTPPPPDVVELCRETFQKTAEYLRGELDGTIEDYKLLEKMNKVTMNKYSEMKHIALSISGALKDLNEKYKSLQPYLEQIEQIEESVASLEQAAYSLDQYSKRLESKFKALEKR